VLLGTYFREYLLAQGLLSGDAATDLSHTYFRANSIQRSNLTATMFGQGLLPGVTIPVHSYPLNQPDPVFDPISAGLGSGPSMGFGTHRLEGGVVHGSASSSSSPRLILTPITPPVRMASRTSASVRSGAIFCMPERNLHWSGYGRKSESRNTLLSLWRGIHCRGGR
jgi:hypothetical protein